MSYYYCLRMLCICLTLACKASSLFLINEELVVPASAYVQPEIMDIMLPDLNHATCMNISFHDFGFEYNSPTTELPTFPIVGFVLAEPYGRNIIPLILQYKKKAIKSIAIVDTANPFVHLSEQTLRTLGIVDSDHANIKINGRTTFVYQSTNHFKEVNVIGAAYFKKNGLVVISDYEENVVEIKKSAIRMANDGEEI